MLEDFLNSLQNFRRNKMRTMLSILGVIIGVASVIVIMSMGSASTKQIQDTLGSAGLDVVSVSAGFMSRRGNTRSITFDESFRETLYDNIPNIKKVWYKNSLNATLTYAGTSANVQCSAIEDGYLEMYGVSLDYGEYFSVTDNVKGTQKIILGSTVASSLFPGGDAIGKNVTLVTSNVSFSFQVVGVLKEQSAGMESTTSVGYIPRGFYTKKIMPNPAASQVMVQAVSNEAASALVTTIQDYCDGITGSSSSVNVMSMQTMIEQMSSITGTLSAMLAAIAAISLLVGGIGIMNIMIVTVTERKQEIGIRKALGASPAVIKQLFLVESASITIMGGLAGIILGVIISVAAEYVMSLSYVVSGSACVIAFVFSVFVGIFFGLSPASRAAKLDPVKALSGE